MQEVNDPCKCGHKYGDHRKERAACTLCDCQHFDFDYDAYERGLYMPGPILPSLDSLKSFGNAVAGIGLAGTVVALEKPKTAVVDFDGTIALFDESTRHWSEYDKLLDDSLCPVVSDVLRALHASGWTLVGLTGRPERYRQTTLDWLAKHNMPIQKVFMRTNNDKRGNSLYKRSTLAEIRTHYDVRLAFEDNTLSVDMFRSEGVVCFHVRDFEVHRAKTAKASHEEYPE